MKNSVLIPSLALAALLAAGTAFAQTAGTTGEGEKGAATAVVAAPATAGEKAQARASRKRVGAQVAKAGEIVGEDQVAAPAGKKVSKADRTAARKQRSTEMAAANKAGDLKVYGETRVPANAK